MMKSMLAGFFLFCSFSANAAITNIDLNDFYADSTVTVAPDGNSALMAEDLDLLQVLLSNDPNFGDPGIPVPANLLTLNFTYEFVEPTGNDNNFTVLVFDGITGIIIDDFLTETTSAGFVSLDLSLLDPSITLLGLEFELNASDADLNLDSTVFISDVFLETQDDGSLVAITAFLLIL